MSRERILGLDLGIETTGWALLETVNHTRRTGAWAIEASGVLRFRWTAEMKRHQNPEALRLGWWSMKLLGLVEDQRPTRASVEDYILGTKNPRTTVVQAEQGGLVRMLLYAWEVPYRVWGPSAWKREVFGEGAGGWKKDQIRTQAMEKGWAIQEMGEDEVDAVCIGMAEYQASRRERVGARRT